MTAPFLLDSNFFIEAHRTSYPFDVVPSFWAKVKELADNGKIISIDKVKKEILQNKDELSEWLNFVGSMGSAASRECTQISSLFQVLTTYRILSS